MRDALMTERPVSVSLFREKTVIDYPNAAVRELMMNACMHRDYQSNMPVRLYQFDDHIEIMNEGGLYGEARPENVPTVNDYRNPLVAAAMKELHYVNMFNQGIRRVQGILRKNGSSEAEFDVSKLTVFEVRVGAHPETVGAASDVTMPKKEKKSVVRQRQIVSLIEKDSKLTAERLADLLGVSSRTIQTDLSVLTKAGVIAREGEDNGGEWRLLL